MKTLEEFKENYILFTMNSRGQEPIFMLNREKIESVPLHETYDNNGQIVGHCNSGDYTFQNPESDAKENMLKEIGSKFSDEELEEIENYLCNSDIDDLDISESSKELLKDWLSDNEYITTCEAYTFWNGHNHQSIVFETESGWNDLEIEECSNKEYEAVFNELYKNGENIWECTKEQTGFKIFETETFFISISYWEGSFADYEIEYK